MQRWVTEQNIAHYREMLAGDLDHDQRRTIERLLADEEAKLKRLAQKSQAAC